MGAVVAQVGVPAGWKGTKPALWNPQTAMSLSDVGTQIGIFLDDHVPFSREMLVLIFFHESAFSIVNQGGPQQRKGPGFGLGQLELDNPQNPTSEFLMQEFGTTNRQAIVDAVGQDGSRAVKMHCDFLKWLMGRQAAQGMTPTQTTLLAGQVGAKNVKMIEKFTLAEPKLSAAIQANDRDQIIGALNSCRWYLSPGGDGSLVQFAILLNLFPDYWNFTLPQSDLASGSLW